jgi:hypothetical protein
VFQHHDTVGGDRHGSTSHDAGTVTRANRQGRHLSGRDSLDDRQFLLQIHPTAGKAIHGGLAEGRRVDVRSHILSQNPAKRTSQVNGFAAQKPGGIHHLLAGGGV